MELHNHDEIIRAIESRREVAVTFRSKKDGGVVLTRRSAPMDFAPSTRAHDKTPRYHFWDFESDGPYNHTLSLLARQIVEVEVLETTFDPATFVTWKTSWTISRSSWGQYN